MELTNGKFSSLYLTQQINVFRKLEKDKSELRHSDLLKKIEKEFEEEINERKISLVNYKDKKGEVRKAYELNYKQSKLYKNELYPQFREFILVWLNGNGKKYFTTNTRLLLNK